DGINTKKLLAHCEAHDAVLHVIDPAPRFDVAAWQQRFGARFVLHREPSLAALPRIDQIDAVMIDGDHNWYTVISELRVIAERCSARNRPFPLAFLHDIGWPYGRRDLYYDPATIPPNYRQAYAQSGVRPGVPALVPGGMNSHLCNAAVENTPYNGV